MPAILDPITMVKVQATPSCCDHPGSEGNETMSLLTDYQQESFSMWSKNISTINASQQNPLCYEKAIMQREIIHTIPLCISQNNVAALTNIEINSHLCIVIVRTLIL